MPSRVIRSLGTYSRFAELELPIEPCPMDFLTEILGLEVSDFLMPDRKVYCDLCFGYFSSSGLCAIMKAVFWKMFSLCRFLPDAPFDLFLLDDPCEPLSELPLSTLSLNLLPELRERRSLLSVLSGSKPCAC